MQARHLQIYHFEMPPHLTLWMDLPCLAELGKPEKKQHISMASGSTGSFDLQQIVGDRCMEKSIPFDSPEGSSWLPF